MYPLISIIIPTYNRAHLIGETLDSILAQTYTNWECLITDDGSTDNSIAVIQEYVNKDTRFKLFTRPANRPKGANACRNIGLENAVGEYIVFFDSDDLMTPDHLQVKIDGMLTNQCDYVITRTKFFNVDKPLGANNYRFNQYELTPYNYISQAVNWLTYDVCLKSEIAKKLNFNEALQSGQEFNYFSKLVYISTNYKFIDQVVSLRRYHTDSIRSKLDSSFKKAQGSFQAKWRTYLDIRAIAERKVRVVLLKKCLFLILDHGSKIITDTFKFYRAIFREYSWRGFYFIGMLISLKLFGKGHFFYKKIISNY